MKDFLSFLDYSPEALTAMLDRADVLADLWRQNQMPLSLKNHQVGLWFWGQGFRNRVAFEMGARAMGASVTYLPGELGVHEPLEDIGAYLQNWFTLLVVRAKSHPDLQYLAAHTAAPVINARTNHNHPCEVMGDLQFVRQQRGSLQDMRVVFVGELSNLGMSWLEAAVKFPIQVTQVAPPPYLANPSLVERLNSGAVGHITTSNSLAETLPGAELVYTDCFPRDTPQGSSPQVLELFLPYQITAGWLDQMAAGGIFLPCPPVTRGQEVSVDAMLAPACLNYRAKEYLLHSQNAIMEMLIKGQLPQPLNESS